MLWPPASVAPQVEKAVDAERAARASRASKGSEGNSTKSSPSRPGATSPGSTQSDDGRAGGGGEPSVGVDVALLGAQQQLSDGSYAGARRGCCDCAPRAGSWRAKLAAMVTSDGFGNLSTALVIVNMIMMTMGYAGMSAEYADRLEDGATVITVIFMVEMVLKLVGLGCAAYWADGWNKVHAQRRALRPLSAHFHRP